MFSKIKSKLSIYTKLRLIVIRVLAISFFLLFILLTLQNVYKSFQNERDHIQMMAEVIATNIDTSLLLKDSVAAQQTLDTLSLSSSPIEYAALIDNDRELFASLGENIAGNSPLWKSIKYYHPVMFNNRKLGELHIVVSLSEMWIKIIADLVLLAVALSGALFLAIYLIRDFASTIVEPIKKLAETSRIITKTEKYGLRTEKISDDEVGQLTDTVNEMLDLIEMRDGDLRIAATAFNTQEAIVITDVDKNIIRVNPAYTKITGYKLADVEGKQSLILAVDREDENLSRTIDGDITNKGFWQGELISSHRNGYRFPGEFTITVVKNIGNEITNYVMTFTDISERVAAEEKIRTLAFYDSLTQLPNRRLLVDRLKLALTASERHNNFGALFFLDLDKFKILNDSKGHHYGDMLLVEVAKRLAGIVRSEDTVARLGGDEFVVMLERLDDDETQALAEANSVGNKIVEVLNQPYDLTDFIYESSSSVGVTLFRSDEKDVATILSQSDTAMYAAKNAGRNTLRFFGAELQDALEKRIEDEQELRLALDKNQFELHYQVQVNNKGETEGAEALIRWQHPSRGTVLPIDFIPLSEETHIIDGIGKWVIESACQQLKQWQQNNLRKHLVVSINISVLQFQKDDFVADLLAVVKNYRINPQKLKLELTESVVLQDVEEAIKKMKQLKASGITISMDDFGTGYSSLNYISRLPVDQIKIDRSFISRATDSKHDELIIKMVVALGHLLNIGVVAEGIETKHQHALLKSMGCDYYQGYYFGKPMPIREFELLLQKKYSPRIEMQELGFKKSKTIKINS